MPDCPFILADGVPLEFFFIPNFLRSFRCTILRGFYFSLVPFAGISLGNNPNLSYIKGGVFVKEYSEAFSTLSGTAGGRARS